MAEVRIQEGETLENALKRFKRKVLQEDIIKEVKRHAFYLKPGQKKRVKSALARKRNRKKRNRVMSENRICLRLRGLPLTPEPGATRRYVAENRFLTLA